MEWIEIAGLAFAVFVYLEDKYSNRLRTNRTDRDE